MTERYLSISDVAQMAGLKETTIRNYSARGLMPEPAVIVGHAMEHRGWTREQIRHWMDNRPGRGARTDLR